MRCIPLPLALGMLSSVCVGIETAPLTGQKERDSSRFGCPFGQASAKKEVLYEKELDRIIFVLLGLLQGFIFVPRKICLRAERAAVFST